MEPPLPRGSPISMLTGVASAPTTRSISPLASGHLRQASGPGRRSAHLGVRQRHHQDRYTSPGSLYLSSSRNTEARPRFGPRSRLRPGYRRTSAPRPTRLHSRWCRHADPRRCRDGCGGLGIGKEKTRCGRGLRRSRPQFAGPRLVFRLGSRSLQRRCPVMPARPVSRVRLVPVQAGVRLVSSRPEATARSRLAAASMPRSKASSSSRESFSAAVRHRLMRSSAQPWSTVNSEIVALSSVRWRIKGRGFFHSAKAALTSLSWLIGATPHPSPRAWLDATEALSFAAARRDGDAAAHTLTRAARAVDADRRTEPPPWPWVFPFDHRLPRRRSRTRWPIAQGPARSNGESTDVPGSRLIRMVFFRASGIR